MPAFERGLEGDVITFEGLASLPSETAEKFIDTSGIFARFSGWCRSITDYLDRAALHLFPPLAFVALFAVGRGEELSAVDKKGGGRSKNRH